MSFQSPFDEPSQEACDAVCAMGATCMQAANLIVVNRILRLTLKWRCPGVQQMTDLWALARDLAPIGVCVEQSNGTATLRYVNGKVCVQCARDRGLNVVFWLGVSEHTDALVVTTFFAHLAAAGYRDIQLSGPPKLENLVVAGRMIGTIETERMFNEAYPTGGTRTSLSSAKNISATFVADDTKRDCVVLVFMSGSMIFVNMHSEPVAQVVISLLLPLLWKYFTPQ